MLKVGAVSYINALPLFFPFMGRDSFPGVSIEFAPPAEINRKMQRKELDIAIISTACFLRHLEQFSLFCDLGIASTGTVGSVKLYYRHSIKNLDKKIIELSSESETSNELIRIICSHFWNISPQFSLSRHSESNYLRKEEGFLLIGDECLKNTYRETYRSIDLGEEWLKWTGLPFVFAVFAIQNTLNKEKMDLAERFRSSVNKAYAWSMNYPREIILEAKKRTNLDERLLRHYFAHLQYRLQQPHIEGIRLFASYLKQPLLKDPFDNNTMYTYATSL